MIRNIEKTISGLGVIVFSAFLLSSCNTVQGTASGVENTAYGVGQTVEGTAVGAEKDVNVVAKSTSKHKMMDDANHEPAGQYPINPYVEARN